MLKLPVEANVDVDVGRGTVSTRHGALNGCHPETLLCTLLVEKSARRPGEFGFGTTRGVHEIVRGTAVHGVLWAGQHGGCQKQRSSYVHVFGGSGEETGSSVNESGKRCPNGCTIQLPAVQNSLATSSRSPSWRTRNLSCTSKLSEMSR